MAEVASDQDFMNLIRAVLGMDPLIYQAQEDIPVDQMAIDGKKLASAVNGSSLTISEICRRTKMSRENLYKILDGTRQRMKRSNAVSLSLVLYRDAIVSRAMVTQVTAIVKREAP